MKLKISLNLLDHTRTPVLLFRYGANCLTTSNRLGQVTGTCIYVPQKKCCYGSMSITIIFMLSILQITGALSSYLNKHFSANRTVGHFNCFSSDHVIGQSINKGQKGEDGITSSSTSEGTVQR